MLNLALILSALFFSQQATANTCDVSKIKFHNRYKDSKLNEQLLRRVSKKCDNKVEYQVFGHSVLGKPLSVIRIAQSPHKKYPVWVNCAHHGLEWLSTEYCYQIIQALLQKENEHWLDQFEFWIAPLVNPDGRDASLKCNGKCGRKNAAGVDLNRNYPFKWGVFDGRYVSSNPKSAYYRGPSPASEPETQAVMRLSEQERFVLAFGFHTSASKIMPPYAKNRAAAPVPNTGKQLAQVMVDYAKTGRQDKEYRLADSLYPTNGINRDWHYFKHQTYALLIEGSRHNPPVKTIGRYTQGILPGFWAVLQSFLTRPKVEISTVDRDGQPVSAKIYTNSQKHFENEVFTTSPQSGKKIFVLDSEGQHEFVVNETRHQITAQGSLTRVTLTVP